MITRANELKEYGIYDAISKRLGRPCDESLGSLTPRDIVRAWAGWELGDASWADTIIDMYEHFKELD